MEDHHGDAVVVGGRVAGALTAAHLAAAGMAVTVLESGVVAGGTISTHFFRGDGLVRALDEIGVLDAVLATGAPALTVQHTYVRSSERVVEPPQEPGEVGYCLSVRREALDPLVAGLVARRPGVTWIDRRRVVDVVRGPGGDITGVVDSAGDRHLARLVVGADGRRSTVARLVDAPLLHASPPSRFMAYRYLADYPGADPVGPEFSWGENELVYAFPSDAGLTCLAISVPVSDEAHARRDLEGFIRSRLAGHLGLRARYLAGTPVGRVVAGVPTTDFVRGAAGPGWALVGDAGTHQDPWTGFGMDTAARQARALASAVTRVGRDWAEAYARQRDAVTLERYELTTGYGPDLDRLLDPEVAEAAPTSH